GAMAAEGRVYLTMNVPREALQTVLNILPALKNPTVSSLADDSWVAVNTIVGEKEVRDLIPPLKKPAQQGLLKSLSTRLLTKRKKC
ncbi:MAG: hypothetical protein IKW80_03140, partial [Thermoguttaceae bacterium]|nr:hypothetical protein [Thermoguttaceae bacterium]